MDSNTKASNPLLDGRRSFLKGAGLTGLGLASSALLAAAPAAHGQTGTSTATDVEFLNFYLILEYLEAEFYTMAFYGLSIEQFGIPVTGTGKSGPTTGGSQFNMQNVKVKFPAIFEGIAKEITFDEQTHVRLLHTILGDQAIAKPEINLDALGTNFQDFGQLLSLARDFEDVGVSAYGGAAPLLSPTTLATAARIALTEAYHASALRLLVAENKVASLPVDGLDVPPPPIGSKYFTVDDQGLAIVRTPSEVLSIVYGKTKTGASKGGFFPKGVNGAITTV